jgi:hypothetical protein
MNINEFDSLYESDINNSDHLFERWDKEKDIDELLNTPIAPGVIVFDLLHGDYSLDQIKPELKDAFQALMKDKADTYEEIRALMYGNIIKGDNSVQGMINKILGQIGENQFIEEAGKLGIEARLAESGSQKGWDVALPKSDGTTEYVQVKFFSEPNRVIQEIEELNRKIQLGEITDGDQVVKSINFAVPKDIHDEVVQKVNELNLNTKVHEINLTSAEGRDIAELGFGFSADASVAVGNFFSELLGSLVTVASLHILVNGFLLYKGAKNFEEFYSDTIVETTISTGAIGAGMGTEAVLTELSTTISTEAIGAGIGTEAVLTELSTIGGPALFILVLGSTISTRAILKRIANRQSYVDWLNSQNTKLEEMMVKIR